jgi:hypothetical protein
MAVYAGAGVLGVAGAVEWPVAVTGAAVAWLTQQRPRQGEEREQDAAAGPSGADGDTAEAYGAGDKLASSHFHHEHAHETAARVGDPATASALKQVAEASAHHDPAEPEA